MRIYSLISVLMIISFLAASCSGEQQNSEMHSEHMDEEMEHSAHEELAMKSGEPTGESIYNVSSTWKNRDNREISLSDLRGKVQVVAMVYTHCEFACPRILADMQRVRQGLSDHARENTNFVIISIDPERDTPERLSDFADENGLSNDHWTLLNGSQGDILEAAALLGVRYKRISETDFTHSNMITVLNIEGEIVHQRKQLTDNQSGIIQSIERLLSS